MIGIIGILGFIAGVIAACAAISAAVSVGCAADAAVKQKAAQNRAEDRQMRQLAAEKSQRKQAALRSRRAAAAGTLASIIEAKRNKYETDATYRKLSRVQSTKAILGQARVNRSTYHYGTPVGS
jgi:uncharacterized protein HemX